MEKGTEPIRRRLITTLRHEENDGWSKLGIAVRILGSNKANLPGHLWAPPERTQTTSYQLFTAMVLFAELALLAHMENA
jgi:hypothetical protein